MRAKRLLSTLAALVVIGLCAFVVITIAKGTEPRTLAADVSTTATLSSVPAQPAGASTEIAPPIASSTTSSPTGSNAVSPSPHAAAKTSAPKATPSKAPTAITTTAKKSSVSKTTSAAPAPVKGQALPLGYATGSATEVITVIARSTSSTTATLQAWNKAPGGGWLKRGAAMTANVGSAGLTTHPSESLSATPIGSFGLSRAFGALANPGTLLPYHRTTSADWWVSEVNSAKHLAAETPYYNYAVVIESNTTAPITAGAGSAFFLHVAPSNSPTAGCVSIPPANLVSIMQWLTPSAHARILIGIG
jgi:L,D-peptidoglycan transpeptidase YkuD (ErfK/YbiS/YcfS/YnhG family)